MRLRNQRISAHPQTPAYKSKMADRRVACPTIPRSVSICVKGTLIEYLVMVIHLKKPMIITFQISFIFTTAYSYHNFDLVLTPPEKFESTYQSPAILDLCFRKTRVGKSHNYRDVNVFEKLHFQNCFPSTLNR